MVLFNVMHYDLSLKRGHVCDNVPLQLSSLPWLSSWPLYQWPGPEIWKSWHWQPEDPFSPSPRDGAWPPPTWRHLHPWRLPSHHRMESPLEKQESHVKSTTLTHQSWPTSIILIHIPNYIYFNIYVLQSSIDHCKLKYILVFKITILTNSKLQLILLIGSIIKLKPNTVCWIVVFFAIPWIPTLHHTFNSLNYLNDLFVWQYDHVSYHGTSTYVVGGAESSLSVPWQHHSEPPSWGQCPAEPEWLAEKVRGEETM